jgi:prepilin peptidase CpaA
MLSSSLVLIFPAAMAFAAAMDMITMTIPNRISLALVAAFAIIVPFSGLPLSTVALHVAAGAIMLAAGIGMFAAGWVGGGDAKLLAAGALWLGMPQLLPFLLLTGVLGGLLMVVVLIYRWYPATALPLPDWALKLHRRETGLPYGIAIGGAAILVYQASPMFSRLV